MTAFREISEPVSQHIRVDIHVHRFGNLLEPTLVVVLLLDLMLSLFDLSSDPDPFF